MSIWSSIAGQDWVAVEIKAGRTPSADYFSALLRLSDDLEKADRQRRPAVKNLVIYAGEPSQKRSGGRLLSWSDIETFAWSARSR